MKIFLRLIIFTVVAALPIASAQDKKTSDAAKPASDDAIDFNRARQLMVRKRGGEKLSADEEAYLQRAIEARRRNPGAAGGGDSRTLLSRQQTGLKPLCDMSAKDRYLDQDGGMYGAGMNVPPKDHQKATEQALGQIQPLNAAGKPDPKGQIVLVSISMSNATQEFSRFKQIADADKQKSSQLTIVDCAQGGQAMAEWVSADAATWKEADRRIQRAGVSPEQVQVAWVKLANKGPRGDLETHGRKLQKDTLAVIQNAKRKFPNLQIIYMSSRIYGGYSGGALNPEPYAYESAFPVRWMIQDQIAGKPELNHDATHGAVKAPVLLWGPYMWADGITPREDGLKWTRDDLGPDSTHPSEAGRNKVAKMLLTFFSEDPLAKSWFLGKTQRVE